MLIFIDESGTFLIPTKPHSVSCVAALVIPEPFAGTLFRRFRRLIRQWRQPGEELKGSQLSEQQMAAVVKLVRRFDVLLFVTCIDMGLHTETEISTHKIQHAAKFLGSLPETAASTFRSDVEGLARRITELSNQLYVQSTVLSYLIDHVIRMATLYYVQRLPMTLGGFTWVIDAKGQTLTNYESLWREIVMPYLQSMSFREPMAFLEDANYSAFRKFEDPVPAFIEHAIPPGADRVTALNIKKIVREDLRFAASHRYTGLQMVDMLASAVRRACNGTLGRRGWSEIGRLMPRAEKGTNSIKFISLDPAIGSIRRPPYNDVVKECDRSTKRMVT